MANQTHWCDAIWLQRALNALRETLDVSGADKQSMIDFLFDVGLWRREQLTNDAALARFNDCLNPGKPKKFSIAEVWVLMKQFERFQLLQAIAADTGHDIHRIPTMARVEQLLEQVRAGMEQINAAQSELLRIGAPLPLRVHPAVASGEALFDKGGF